jgi:hypothetical protein
MAKERTKIFMLEGCGLDNGLPMKHPDRVVVALRKGQVLDASAELVALLEKNGTHFEKFDEKKYEAWMRKNVIPPPRKDEKPAEVPKPTAQEMDSPEEKTKPIPVVGRLRGISD